MRRSNGRTSLSSTSAYQDATFCSPRYKCIPLHFTLKSEALQIFTKQSRDQIRGWSQGLMRAIDAEIF